MFWVLVKILVQNYAKMVAFLFLIPLYREKLGGKNKRFNNVPTYIYVEIKLPNSEGYQGR